MELTSEAIELIKANQNCRNRLAYVMRVNARTIDRWLNEKNILLTTAIAIKIISEETGISRDKLFNKQITIK